MQIIKNSNIDFVNNSKFTILLSSALILASIFSLIINKGPELSIDFKGGTLIAVNYTKPVNLNDLRSKLKTVNIDGKNFDFSSAEIKHFGNESSVALRIANIENEPENFSGKLIEVLKDSFPDGYPKNKNDFILSIGKVSPKVGSELSGKAIMAIIYAITLILIYISLRFEFVFAIGAIAAIAHDVTITLGIFSILGYEISLPVVAAFLTIVGYSLNDTIVIFDRIRENLKTIKKGSIVDTVNKSINESLSRTIVTSLTTFFVVLILFFFGGEVIRYEYYFNSSCSCIVGCNIDITWYRRANIDSWNVHRLKCYYL
jgi:preprotein translocase subunit SecF